MELSMYFQAFEFVIEKYGNPETKTWAYQLFFEKVRKLKYSAILNR